MKKWKIYEISLFILSCVLMNFIGRMVAEHFSLPLWLDTMGTAMSAYIGGPVAGALVGLTGSFLYAIKSGTTFAFAQTNLILGLFIGLAVKKYGMKNLVSIIMLGGLSAALAVFISVPLDILYNDGMTGNVWGNGVLLYLQERNFPHLLCLISGAAFVDFPDKLITMLAMFASLRIHQLLKNEERAAHEPMTLGGEALDALHEAEAEMKREAAQAADAHIVIDTGEEDGSAKGEKSKKNGILRRFGKRRNTAGIFLLLLMLTFVFQAAVMQTAAQAAETEYNDYVQTVYSSSNGLPCGEANDIAQTNDGILWIGTYAGLYRYNGSDFRWMDDYDSVRNVNCLYVDKEGRLWIGTNDKGLSIMIDEKIVNVVDSTEGLPSDSVRCIAQSADGYYYVGTTGSMQILSLNSGLKRINTLWEVNYADDISADTKGYVAVVTSDGRLFLIRDGVILSSLQLSAQNGVFTCCEFTPDGQLLAGTSDGVMETYDISSETFEKREEIECQGLRSLNDFSFLDDGSLFITADNGIGYIDTDHTFHNIQVNDFDNSIDNMLVDYQGNFWYTSTRLGLLRLSASPFRNVFSSAGLEPKVVNTVEKWGEDYYIGTDSGLDIVNEDCSDTIENELTAQLEGIRIRCLFTDSRGDLWICTYGKGLWQVHPDGKIVLYNAENGSFGDRARMVTELSDGSILAAGNTGISFIRDEKVLKTIGYADGLINSMILTVVELPDGRILAGTDGDGIAVIEDGAVTHMLTRLEGLSSGVILRTVLDEAGGGVFIVTSNGLCYMDQSGTIRTLDNFPYFNNYDVWVKDRDTLFISGSAGIYVVNREELLSDREEISYDLLDAKKGLSGALTANSWNYASKDGSLFLSCDRGVFVLDTNRYNRDNRSYRMTISSVLLDNVPTRIRNGSLIHVSRGVSRIELFPEIINYTIQNPYIGYYLEGYEGQWNILPQSSVTSVSYTNLPSGTYSFHLAVFDSNKERILEERVYSLVKDKEIYDNGWFKIYMLIVVMLFVAWVTWFIMYTQIRKTMEIHRKTMEIQKQTMEIQERELEVANQQVQMGNETIMTIAKTVDAKDVRTSEHSQREAEYSAMIGRELGFSETECENLRKAASMHDIGKIGIPDSILNKPSRLDDEEYAKMKTHVTRGSEILKNFTMIDHVAEGARFHHERYDGRGYPDGLKGEEIPLYGRIIGVADAFDAMTANRVYRKQMDFGYVLEEMRKGRGTQFDPQMVDILLRLIDEGKIDLKKLYGVKEEEGGEQA